MSLGTSIGWSFEQLETDLELEDAGVWCRYQGTPVEFRIRRQTGNAAQAAYTELSGQLQNLDADSPDAQALRIRLAPFVAQLVADWRGLDAPYSQALILEKLKLPQMRDLFDWVLARSRDMRLYRKRQEDSSTKKSA